MTKAERIFFDRMAPYIAAGKSLIEAGRAVLDDDQRIWLATLAKTEGDPRRAGKAGLRKDSGVKVVLGCILLAIVWSPIVWFGWEIWRMGTFQ